MTEDELDNLTLMKNNPELTIKNKEKVKEEKNSHLMKAIDEAE